MEYYKAEKWKDFGDFYIYVDNQGTIGWKQSKMGRVSGSTVSYCVGHTHYADSTPEDMALYISKVKEKPERPRGKVNMELGVKYEPMARNWYLNAEKSKISYNGVLEVIEVGFMVPKFDRRIGASPDGLVLRDGKLEGIIEIKCPKESYRPIKEYLKEGNPYTETYEHIWKSHYDQMQMEMAVINVEWCDYIVFCPTENFIFVERVYRNRNYWNDLYGKIKIFITERLQPLLDSIGSMYPLLPPI
jgi:hypothetical protein